MLKDLHNKHLVLGITGGIAAYKAAELCRQLMDAGATVQVVMSPAATQFITPLTMQALSGRPVISDAWDQGNPAIPNAMPHIEPSRAADAIIVAPATADFMAKLAHGFGNDALSNLCLARNVQRVPLLIAPAMNVEMWQNPATQRNLITLKSDGIHVLGPATGVQACGEVGAGRLLEPAHIVSEVCAYFQPKLIKNKRVLVTAGPTFEPIDPVRGITNTSSGKMGYAIARAAREAGAQVTLVTGPTALPVPYGVQTIAVRTAQEMLAAVLAEQSRADAPALDVFFSVAAVADWRVDTVADQKIKKPALGGENSFSQLNFVTNPDILATVAALATQPYCVGFAAETEQIEAYARSKRAAKRIPMIVANDAKQAMGSDDNALIVMTDADTVRLAKQDKLAAARALVALVAKNLNNN